MKDEVEDRASVSVNGIRSGDIVIVPAVDVVDIEANEKCTYNIANWKYDVKSKGCNIDCVLQVTSLCKCIDDLSIVSKN